MVNVKEYVEMFQEYSAEEMKNKSRKHAMSKVSENFEWLLSDIVSASEDGKFSISYNEYLSVFEEELLIALGYEVFNASYVSRKGFTNYVEYSYKISWKNADK